jgi:tetratricopeptide (TPR) repeat protein
MMVNETELAALARRLCAEKEEAIAFCDKVLSGPSVWWAQRLRTGGGMPTTAVVQQLLERMRTRIECAPEEAQRMTEMAVELAAAVDREQYPRMHVDIVEAQALRDHAYVLAFRGLHGEALPFAERSEAIFATIPMASYEAARLMLVKATIFRSTGRTDEAAELTRSAAETFLRFGDRIRYVNARITEGTVYYVAGAVERALDTWTSVENDPALDDAGSVRVAHNIGLCLADLGQHAAAVPYLYQSAMHFELLGLKTECTRSRGVLGRCLVAAGKPRDAMRILRQAVRELAEFGMVFDAGLICLELVEALIAADEPADVPAVCREAIAHFTRAGVPSRAMTALTYLREANNVHPATAPVMVRDTAVSLRRLYAGREARE